MNNLKLKQVFALFITVLLWSCGSSDTSETAGSSEGSVESKRAGVNEVLIHESSDFDNMNPVTSTSANAGIVQRKIFMPLLGIHPETFEYIPMIAESRPTLTEVDEGEYAGGLTIDYRIRTEAVWPNGTPVTGYDAEFLLKVVKNPQVDCAHSRPYYEYIDDIKVDEEDPKKFTLFCNDRYFMAEIWSALQIIPEYVYDPDQLMRKFTVKELNNKERAEELKGDADIITFAQNFNSEKYQREKGFVVGPGPYEYDEWVTGQRMVLTKKKDWWGNQFMGKLPRFDAYPDKLIYEIITDPTTAVTAMKDEGLDVMRGIRSKDFVELREDEQFLQKYALHSPMQLSYLFLGFHMKNPKLSDKRVRQALSHAIDIDYVIKVLYYGLAERLIGPIHPSKPYYNHDIELYDFNLAKAKELLTEAGWTDTDGDGLLDKVIDGKKTPMKIEFLLPSGGTTGEKIALIFQKNLQKLGIELEIIQKEWTVFIDQTKSHDYEMMLSGWSAAPTLSDLKQIWHTTSYNGGSNYVGFGNEYTDELIEKIRYENDEEKRNQMYFEIQEIIHDEAPYIFMLTPNGKISIHKRFNNAKGVVYRPGYMVEEFQLDPDFGVKATAENL